MVIVCASDDSNHNHLVTEDCDLFVIYTGNIFEKFKQDGRWYLQTKGNKWSLVKQAIRHLGNKIDKYRVIWIPDEDAVIPLDNLKTFLKSFEYYKMNLAQPAREGDTGFLQPSKEAKVRFTNFVSTSVPAFSPDAIKRLFFTFSDAVYGMGWVWPNILGFDRTGIIDEVTCLYNEPEYNPIEKIILRQFGIHSPFYTQIKSVRKEAIKVCGIDIPELKKSYKLSRPMRRSNGCSGACATLSARMINYTARI